MYDVIFLSLPGFLISYNFIHFHTFYQTSEGTLQDSEKLYLLSRVCLSRDVTLCQGHASQGGFQGNEKLCLSSSVLELAHNCTPCQDLCVS